MKKTTVLFIIFIFVLNYGFTQNLNYDYDIVGVYLPVEYIKSLESTKHNPVSWALTRGNYQNTVYIVDFDTIHAFGRYDGTENIYIWDIFKFQFEYINDEIYLIDNYNSRFKKIPGDLLEHEYWGDIIGNFIGITILGGLIESGYIILNNNLVTFPTLDNKIFRIHWQAYDPREKRNLSFEGVTEWGYLSLEIRSNEYIFFGFLGASWDNIVWSKKL